MNVMKIKDAVTISSGTKAYNGHILAEGGDAYDFCVVHKVGNFFTCWHGSKDDLTLIDNKFIKEVKKFKPVFDKLAEE